MASPETGKTPPALRLKLRLALGYLLRVALLVGALLAGWGLDDARGFFSHPARVALVLLLASAGLVGLALSADPPSLQKGKKTVGSWLLLVWIAFSLALAIFLPYADRRGVLTFTEGNLVRYAGLALFVAGGAIRITGALALGRQFSGYVTLQEEHKLVQHGLYSVIRHPLYLGLLITMPGLVLIFRSLLAAPTSIAALVFVLMRIRQEEELLRSHFGTEFEAYRARTWRLIPYLF